MKFKIISLIKKIISLQLQALKKLRVELKVRRICEKRRLEEWECNLIVAVIYAESDMNPKAINRNWNGSYDYGLCQYNSEWYIEKMQLITKWEALNDINKCVNLMIDRYRKGRIDDWVGYWSGLYLKYL